MNLPTSVPRTHRPRPGPDRRRAGVCQHVRVATWADPLRQNSSVRVVGVDVARCLALLGMMATHILSQQHVLHEVWAGRASALFAILAGLSLTLMSGGRKRHRGRRLAADAVGLGVRALAIAAIGLWLGGFETNVAVILVYYGVLFLLGLPFLAAGPRTLFALAGGWCLAAPVVSHLLRDGMATTSHFVPTVGDLHDIGRLLTDLLLTGYYPALPWLTYLLAGMALGRLDLRKAWTAAGTAAGGLAVAAVALMTSAALTATEAASSALLASTAGGGPWADMDAVLGQSYFGTTPTDTWWWLAIAEPHSGTPLDLAHTAGSAFLVLGVALLVTRAAPRVWAIALGAGAMTLTLYSAHVIMLTPDVWPTEPGAGGPGVADYYRTQVLTILGVGALFAAVSLRGPLELVVKLLSRLGTRGARAVLPRRR